MVSASEVLDTPRFSGYSIREVPLPEYEPDTVERCLGLCRQNACGKYGTNWACPPGFDEHMDSLSERYSSAILVSRTLECDPRDAGKVEEFNETVKSALREMVSLLRSAGIDCRGFADGGCGLCQTCAYPEPCVRPDDILPSVSGLGVDMGRYLESVGEDFAFRDDAVTFYGIIMLA